MEGRLTELLGMRAELTYPLAAVPTLDELIANPALADSLPPATTAVLLGRAGIVTAALQARLLAAVVEHEKPAAALPESDSMLTVDEAALRLRHSRQWIYRNAATLPFVKRISRKSLLCSEAGLQRWLDRRRA